MSIKSQKDYLFKKSAQKFLTDEIYEDMEKFANSDKEKEEKEYPNNIKLIMTRVENNGFKTILIKDGKEMNIVKEGC